MARNDMGNLPDDKRCIAVIRDRDEEGNKLETKHRCRNPKMLGNEKCNIHDRTKAAKIRREKTKQLQAMAKFGQAISASDPEADIVYGFEMEYRRTVGNIRYCQEQIEALQAEQLVWGKSKLERIDASEYPGTNVTFEAKVNLWLELQMRERKHFLEMQKIWIGAKLDAKRLEINQTYVIMLDRVISNSLNKLGLDSSDPEIRNVIRGELLALPMKG